MNINFWLNGVNRNAEIQPDTLLIDFLREQGCFSVKRGCAFLQYTCSSNRRKEDRNPGRNAERSTGVRKFPGQ